MAFQHEPVSPSVLVNQALDLYESSLIAYATSILGGDEERARDVVQDTLLKLYLADPQRVSENLKAWLYAVCRNRALDVLRKEHRLVLADDDDRADWLDELQSEPAHDSGRDEILEQIWHAAEQLPKNQQDVLRLKFQHDLSYKDISNTTGLSVTNVGFLLHTAVKRLRKVMSHALHEEISPKP
jgi:RNA polymerase sigma factor (sigma-70 family)